MIAKGTRLCDIVNNTTGKTYYEEGTEDIRHLGIADYNFACRTHAKYLRYSWLRRHRSRPAGPEKPEEEEEKGEGKSRISH